MPQITELRYEFSNYDEAEAAIDKWAKVKPGNINDVPYPKFEIDYIDVEQHDTLIIYLKLKKDE